MKQNQREINRVESELARVYATTTGLYLELSRFYEVASGGLPLGVDTQMETAAQSIDVLRRTGTLDGLLKDGVSVKNFLETYEQEQTEIRRTTHRVTQRMIDAACIVYAHGIIEASVEEYLALTTIALQERWECFVLKRKEELGTFKTKTFEQIRDSKIQKLLKDDVKNESLIDKLDRLHKITPPRKNGPVLEDFVYDRKKLVRLDEARQSIVHGNDWTSYTFDYNQELDYWTRLNAYLAVLVCNNVGVKLSPQKMGQCLKKWSQKYKDF